MGFVGTAVTDAINFTLWSIVILATVLRLLSRKYLVPPLGLDDVYIVFSTVSDGIDVETLREVVLTERSLVDIWHWLCYNFTSGNTCLGNIVQFFHCSA